MTMPATADALAAGREAIKRHAWTEAVEHLSDPAVQDRLEPKDHDSLAEAAWWTGNHQRSIEARERAFAGYMERGDVFAAAMAAMRLSVDHSHKHVPSVARAWLRRAERMLEGLPESTAHGYLARHHRFAALERRDLEAALEHADRTLDIGTRFGDRDLQALGLHDKGDVLIAMGRIEEGLELVDEATVAAVSGELGPLTTGIVYCNTITTCDELADYSRAGEWTEAAQRWCERQSIRGFPGVCRVHRADIMRLRGDWSEAEQEARLALDELRDFNLSIAAEALYEVGEIRLRMGDLEAAEEAFREAHELGREPQPGLAMLRLFEGKPDAALSALSHALDERWDRRARVRLLPTLVEAAIATGDVDRARAAVEELEEVAVIFSSQAIEAAALTSRGAVVLAEGDAQAAVAPARKALRLWQELNLPYEAARTRMLLASAYPALGDEAAELELRAARTTFEKLGADLDWRKATEALTPVAPAGATGRRVTRTFLFTDIERSTNLVEAMGDEAWQDLLRWHDTALRSLFAEHGGEEIKHTGDGFFVAFGDAPAALTCAIGIQRKLSEHRRTHGFAPRVRMGLHAAEATEAGGDYFGRGVNQAARIGALAAGGEILVSRETFDAAGDGFDCSPPRSVTLKGMTDPIDVVGVTW